MNLVEGLTERPLTDGQGKTESRDVKRLIDIRETQLLGLFDKLATRLVAARESFFCSAHD